MKFFNIVKARVKGIKKNSKIVRFIGRKIDIVIDLIVNPSYLDVILKEEFFNSKSDLPFFYIDLNLVTSYYYYFYLYKIINLRTVIF